MAIFPHFGNTNWCTSRSRRLRTSPRCLSTCCSRSPRYLRSVWDYSGGTIRKLAWEWCLPHFLPALFLPIRAINDDLVWGRGSCLRGAVCEDRSLLLKAQLCSSDLGVCIRWLGVKMLSLLCLEEECCCCWWACKAEWWWWQVFSLLPGSFLGLLSCCFKTTMKFWLHCCSSDNGAADVGLVSVFDGVQGHQPEALTWVMEWGPKKKTQRNTKKLKREVIFAITATAFEIGVS